MKQGMGKALVVDFVGSFVMAFTLFYAIRCAEATTILQGLTVGFFAGWVLLQLPPLPR